MFRWNPMIRSLFGLHREQPRARHRQTVKLHLEPLEDRTLLSAPAGNPLTNLFVASSPPAESVEVVGSYLLSTLEQWGQWAATVQQNAISLGNALGQEIVQAEFSIEQQWVRFLGFNPYAQLGTNTDTSQVSIATGTPNGQDSGSSTSHSSPPVVTSHAPSPSSQNGPIASPLLYPPQEWVTLSSSSYSVNEDAGSVAVQVNLFVATSATVSVELTTSDGTATSGVDYSSKDTEVVFQPGTTSMTVNVPIIDDGASDDSAGSESFSVQLSNASGAPLGPTTSATVTIQENSSPPPPPPPPQPAIYGTVWQDDNADGIMEAGEPGLQGILVFYYITWEAGTQGFWTVTDVNGDYQFPNFYIDDPNDINQIYVAIPGGDTATIEDAGSTGIDSNIDSGGYSDVFYYSPGESVNINAGIIAAPAPQTYLVTKPTDDGTGNTANSLSWAINQANANPGSEIDFNINGNTQGTQQKITVSGEEPAINQPVTINGYSQSGPGQNNGTAPWIELDGPGAKGNRFDGLSVTSGEVVIEGLAIGGFNGNGIDLDDPNAGSGMGDTVQGCYIGTDASGENANPNTSDGILIQGANNTIGGANSNAGNLISGNGTNGIDMNGSSAVLNQVENNYIGLDYEEYSPIPNGANGVFIEGGASDNTVGGFNTPGRVGNIIAGNTGSGIRISDVGSTGNNIYGNDIGVADNGFMAYANSDGVSIDDGASSNTIGSSRSGGRNIISGNKDNGITITYDIFNGSMPNDNIVSGNYIGTDDSGSSAVPNGNNGVDIVASTNTGIYNNVISGNQGHGLEIEGKTVLVNVVVATITTVTGNMIGTDVTGKKALGNGGDGIYINLANQNTIGAATSPPPGVVTPSNVISGNNQWGIEMNDSSFNTVINNFIDTDITGLQALGNSFNGGIHITTDGAKDGNNTVISATQNTIGGTTGWNSTRNIISANGTTQLSGGPGVQIDGNTSTKNIVLGNYIGVGADGSTPLGNGRDGVYIWGGDNNTIGGAQGAAGNLISDNGAKQATNYGYGVRLSSDNNTVQNNTIGYDINGNKAINWSGGIQDNGTNNTWKGLNKNQDGT